jgi:hypothetical protein
MRHVQKGQAECATRLIGAALACAITATMAHESVPYASKLAITQEPRQGALHRDLAIRCDVSRSPSPVSTRHRNRLVSSPFVGLPRKAARRRDWQHHASPHWIIAQWIGMPRGREVRCGEEACRQRPSKSETRFWLIGRIARKKQRSPGNSAAATGRFRAS